MGSLPPRAGALFSADRNLPWCSISPPAGVAGVPTCRDGALISRPEPPQLLGGAQLGYLPPGGRAQEHGARLSAFAEHGHLPGPTVALGEVAPFETAQLGDAKAAGIE